MKSKNMNNSKASPFTEFEIVGFPGLQEYKTLLFFGFLILFLLTLTANLLILFFVVVDHRLHTPMYFFLWNLSLLDLLVTIAIIPKLLEVLLEMNKTISFAGCFFQMYFTIAAGGSELFLVAAMAYDRYVAIVKPLQYNVIIDIKACISIAAIVWLLGFLLPIVSVTLASYLPFCASNKILYCFCDYLVVIALSCTDVTLHANLALGLAMVVVFIPFLFVLWSYYRIVISVIRLKTTTSRRKAFSMCSSHLLVVLSYYLSTAVLYISLRIEGISYNERIFIGGLICFFTPLVNPLIYTLRNEKMKEAAKKYLNVYTLFQQGLH
ncbi:olfactory receptor 6N1-like [Erpetoichthys calabaricus]|uniref:olfactory receptor 6N1-like n=1 Tax=Erpetoichthys calabaricus TaxID=27687 RepID=UPI00109F937E|nr:olfactory receptor 6N1-like [Erpetoichthys calabaricus]